MRGAWFAALAAFGLAAPALAADGAQSRAIGYSADGKYFAFEQYGIQDGSGFPYWDIFVLDLAADSWAKGTPVRILLQDQEAKLKEARDKARAAASPLIDGLGIDEPADLVVANPANEVLADRTSVSFNAFYRYHNAGDPGDYQLAVTNVDLPAPSYCSDPDFKPAGMQLTLKSMKSGTETVLARDDAIPKSRYCPLHYDIEAVYTPSSYDVPGRHVAIIGYYNFGFEGEDRRFLAVPFDLEK